MKNQTKAYHRIEKLVLQGVMCLTVLFFSIKLVMAATTNIAISQIPLTITTPVRPQVVIAITNSQSMDGSTITYCNGTGNTTANCDANGFSTTYTNRGGAIMTGAGSITGMTSSSSPTNYSVPSGFVPPITSGATGTLQPYTSSTSGSLQADNSPSRLNVAKAGILSILNNYLATTDFALLSYSGSPTKYNTWAYYMSLPGGFSFTNTSAATSTSDTVLNPCFNYSTNASSSIKSDCGTIASSLSFSNISTNKYMVVASTSDDASINDVLYSTGSIEPIFTTYGTVNPSNPYSYYSLSDYNNASITVSYNRSTPNIGGFATSPTNAGYVPYSPQVMYVQRGWAYGGSASSSSASTKVAMTSLGSSPTTSAITSAYNSFSTYLQPETNSSSSSEIKATAGQSPIYALVKTAQTTFPTSSGNCPPLKYVVLVTDGLPTQDSSGHNWPPLGSAAASGYGVSATFNADGSLKTTNDQALTDAITQIKTLAQNGIKTYVIGLGAGVAPSQNPSAAATLTSMAVAGGTGNYFPAVDPSAFSSALTTILVQIQKGSYDQASVAINTTSLVANSKTYLASYNTSDTPNSDWTGSLSAYSLVSNGVIHLTNTWLWDAQTQVDSSFKNTGWKTSRIIATWDAVNNTGVPFEWSGTGVTGINATQKALLQPSDTKGSLRLNYLRGDQSNEITNGGGFRNRSHLLGDIIDSGPVYVGTSDALYTDSSYNSYISSTKTRTPMLYIGSNDGMLHAFNANTGNELFAFIPNGVFSNLLNLTSTAYNSSHLFFVDGSPQAGDVQYSDGTWHTLLVGGENAGGKTVFALDITTPQNLTTETLLSQSVLWEFSDADMGYSFSKPTIARVNATASPFAVFFGNGYNSANNKAILYAVNPKTGAQLAKIDLCAAVTTACSSTLPQGLSSVTSVNSTGNLGGKSDLVYAGDLQGNLWAINISANTPANWTVRLVFKAKDSSGTVQPITTTPSVTLNPDYPTKKGLMIYFGTGQLLAQTDLSNTQVQTFYGVYDNLSSSALVRSNLLQQTKTVVTAATSGLSQNIITSTNYDWRAPNPPLSCTIGTNCPTYYGWYFDLDFAGSGTRAVTDSVIYNGNIMFTTFSPATTLCAAGGISYLMGVNYATGGYPISALFDVNHDGKIDSNDLYNGVPPSGISLGNMFASAPNIVTANQSDVSGYVLVGGGGGSDDPNCTNNKALCNAFKVSSSMFWRGWWQIK